MTATRYAKIVDAALIPFIAKAYPTNHHFYQDYDPKHTSLWSQWFFTQKKLIGGHLPQKVQTSTPLRTSGGTMKQAIRNQYKPRTLP